MNLDLPFRKLLPAALLPVFTFLLSGQDKEATMLFELSPFAVVEDQEVGYQATSTLAGTRLNTQLRDVGSAISVLTPEFFEDTGATDAASVLSYAMSMEVAGTQGNYAGGAVGATTYDNSEERSSSHTAGQRVRGLARASLTRGYFLTDIPFDAYNTNSVTINRGPNSLLFGIGEVGGVIDNSLKRASSAKNFGELALRIGEHGSLRLTMDLNRAVIEDRLGVRFALLDEATEYQQRPAYQDNQRYFLTVDAVLLENEGSTFLGKTILRANFESGQIKGTPPNIIPPTDALSPWFSLPKYSVDQLAALNDGTLNPLLSFITDGSFTAKGTYDTRTGSRQNSIPNTGRTPWFFSLPVTYNTLDSPTATVGLPGDPDIQGWIGRVQWNRLDPRRPPNTGQIDALSLQPIEIDFMPGFVAPVIMDRSVLNNENLLISGKSSWVRQKFEARNVALEQGFLNGRGGLELVFDQQTYENENQLLYDSGRSNFLWIDLNEYLPNLEPNPNVGRAFMMSDATGDNEVRKREIDREAMRATAFYKLDLSEKDDWTRWFGSHVLTGVLSRQEFDTLSTLRTPNWIDIPGGSTDIATAQNHVLNQSRRGVYFLNYISGDLRGGDITSLSDLRFTQYFRNPIPQDGDRFQFLYQPDFNRPQLNPANNTPLFVDEFEVYYALDASDHTRQTIDSRVISWQGNFLDGHVVALLGYRYDESVTVGRSGSGTLFTGEWDPANLRLDTSNESLNEGSTVTKGLVVHVPEKWTAAVPFEVSLHYNASENFSALPTRNNVMRRELGSPTGETKDYGFSLEFFDRRLSLRVNWFETSADNITADVSSVSIVAGGYIEIMLANSFTNAEELTIEEYLSSPGQPADAPGRFSSWEDLYNEIMDLTLATSNGNQFNLDQTQATDIFGKWLNPIERVAATTSFVTEGMEIELIGNITPKWRVALNISKQETIESGTAALTGMQAYQLRDEIASSKLDGLLDAVTRSSLDTYLSRLQRNYLNSLAATLAKDGTVSREQRKWRWNLVSSYRFTDGILKGFSAGGAVRWQDKAAVGYESLSVIEGAVIPNLDRPFFDSAQFNADVFASYQRRLSEQFDWKIQLNVRNAFGDDDYIPVIINPDGNAAVVRNPNPTVVYITNTLSF